MKTIGFKVIIFDFDGVLVESNKIKDQAFEQVFKDFPDYYDMMMAYHQLHISASRVHKFEKLLNVIGKKGDKALMGSLMKNFSDYSLSLMKKVSFVPGATELLQYLKNKPVYLASVTPIEDLNLVLEHIGIKPFFIDVYGCPPWTKSGAINDILKKNFITPDQAVLIGDSEGDFQCSKETGVHFIARNSGLPFSEPQEIIFNDLFEVGEFLNSKII